MLWPADHAARNHGNDRIVSKLLTQFIATVGVWMWQRTVSADGMNAMCTLRVEALSFPGMLEDPLIRMMMDSDGVSDGELRELMTHLRDVVVARGETVASLPPQHAE